MTIGDSASGRPHDLPPDIQESCSTKIPEALAADNVWNTVVFSSLGICTL
jgi:hypothetical protein